MKRLLFAVSILALGTGGALADCPEEPLLLHYTGGGTVTCPCFIAGEQAGAIFDAPAEHYPIHIMRIGIGWGSMNVAGSRTRLPKNPLSIVPSGLIVQRLWMGMAGRSTYSHRP